MKRAIRLLLLAVIAVSAFLLNSFFILTSSYHALQQHAFPVSVASFFANIVTWQMSNVGGLFGAESGIAQRQFADYECLALLGLILVSTLLLYRSDVLKAVTRSLQVISLTLMPLGLEIYAFDRQDFYVHVTLAQSTGSFPAWFTNQDLLFASVFVFMIATIVTTTPPIDAEVKSDSLVGNNKLFLLLALALVITVASIKEWQVFSGNSIVWDGASFMANGIYLAFGHSIQYTYDTTRPPLLTILVAATFMLTGPRILSADILSAVLFALAGLGCYVLAVNVVRKPFAVLATIGFMSIPLVYNWSGVLYTNVEGAGLAALSLGSFGLAIKNPKMAVVGVSALILAMFTRYSMAMMIPIVGLYLFLERKTWMKDVNFQYWLVAGGFFGGIGGFGISYVWYQYGHSALFPANGAAPINYLFFVNHLPSMLGEGFVGLVFFGLFIGGATLATISLLRRRANAMILCILAWFAIFFAFYTFAWHSYDTRYMTEFAMPALLIGFWFFDKISIKVTSALPSVTLQRLAGLTFVLLLAGLTLISSSAVIHTTPPLDTKMNVDLDQAAVWIDANVPTTTHLMCDEWTICWWYLPNYVTYAMFQTSLSWINNTARVDHVSYLVYAGSLPLQVAWHSSDNYYSIYRVG